jgi:two-component system OmpR family response regulator
MSILPNVLLIEDDRGIAEALTHALQNSYRLDVAETGRAGLYKADVSSYDIVILDLNLPDLPGGVVCQQLRERGFKAPIMVLSADNQVLSKIKLLDGGANDYLTKPFSLGELKARLRALKRQGAGLPYRAKGELIAGDLVLDRQTRLVKRADRIINLRRKEFSLLECLMENAGTVVNRQFLASYAWQDCDDLWTNTIDVHIKHLRDKVERPFGGRLIHTVHGLGYKLQAGEPDNNTVAVNKKAHRISQR